MQGVASAFGVSEEEARMAPVILVGSTTEMVEMLQRRRERWQTSYIVVPAEAVDAFAPVVDRLAGT